MLDESANDILSSTDSGDSPVARKRPSDNFGNDLASPNKRGRPPGRGRGRGSRGPRGRGRGSRGGGGIGQIGRGGSTTGTSSIDFDGEDDDGTLYNSVKSCVTTTRLRHIADNWIKEYEENRDIALAQLVQFFFSSSGCRGVVNPQYINSGDYTQLIRRMTEGFDEESGEYPIIMSGSIWKRFRQNFCDFIQIVIKQCQYSIIYDQVLMDNMISLLTALADSQVRAFRHTATLAAMKLISALVDVIAQLRQSSEHIKQQLDAEFSKARPNDDRVDSLEKKKTAFEENTEEVNNMINYMFKSIFVHRYRDVLPEIRGICISELGNWVINCPVFLDDSFLKYIGWTLSDKIPEVRLKCLQALVPLYNDDELQPKLELFTNKFKDRIVSMAMDKEFDVACLAVKLVISILKFFPNVLTDRDCESIYELVYSSHRGLAMAAGEFLNVRLFRPDQAAVQGLVTKKGKQRSVNTPLIRDLILFFIESELHQHGAYVIDALIDSNEMVKDWECMTDLLLEEPGVNEEQLDDREESVLIELMVCSIKQAATGEPPVGRLASRKALTQKEHKQVIDEKAKLSKHFIETLPLLLQKYAADGEKVTNLLQIPLYFDLEMYSSMRLEKHLDAMLRCVEEVLDKHTDDEVLQACSKVYECLCNEQVAAIKARCDTAKAKVIDGIVMRLRQNLQRFTEELEDIDEEDLATIIVSMKKIHNLYQCHDLAQWDLWDLLFNIIQPSDDQNQAIPQEMILRALQSCHYACIWDLKRLENTGCERENVMKLKKRLDDFMKVVSTLFIHDTDSTTIRETAYLCLCDLYVMFGWRLTERQAKLQLLVLEFPTGLPARLITFVRDNVFVETEEEEFDEHQQIEVLHKRRNLLSAFCKLVIYGVLRVKEAAEIFQHYVKFYNDYGDIIKMTLGKCRENNKVLCARAMAKSLTGMFKELKEESEDGNLDSHSEAFSALRELAKRFALSFGPDAIKSRDAVATLHKEGIDFALHGDRHTKDFRVAPPNLAFLEALSELSNRLVKIDKKTLLKYLDGQLPENFKPNGDDWQPLITYRNSLLDAEDMPPPSVPTAPGTTPARRGRGRPPRTPAADLTSGFHPATTSTAVKRRRLESDQLSDSGSDFRDGASISSAN